jgi:hypothetical protein
MGWRYTSWGRVPALKAWSPKFKSQFHKEGRKEEKKTEEKKGEQKKGDKKAVCFWKGSIYSNSINGY